MSSGCSFGWHDDGFLVVHVLICCGNGGKELVLDVQLLIDAMEEGFAERTALEVLNDTV